MELTEKLRTGEWREKLKKANLDLIPLKMAGKLIDNPYLDAIRRCFFRMMPFLLAVSFMDIIVTVFLSPDGFILGSRWLNLGFWLTGGLTGEEYQQHHIMVTLVSFRHVVSMGYGILSLVLVLSMSHKLAKLWEIDKVATTFCALTAYMFMLPPADMANQAAVVDYFAERRFFAAFFSAFAASALFAFFCGQKKLRMPPFPRQNGDLGYFLDMTIPISLTLSVFAILALVTETFNFAPERLMQATTSLPTFQLLPVALLYQLVVWLLWWFGIPGYGFTSAVERYAYVSAQTGNQLGDTAYVFTSGFFEAGMMHAVALIIAVMVFSRHQTWRKVAKWCLPLTIFNMQEAVAFGLPVVFNPLFLVPYVLAPLANTAVGYVAISWGIVPVFQTTVPWTMPVLVNGILGTGSYMGGMLQLVWLVMDIFIYAPFVLLANVVELNEDNQESGGKRGDKK